MALKVLFMALLSKLFTLLSWPPFALFFPLCASFRAIESRSHSRNQQCLAFWVLFALFAMLEHTFAKLLLWLPFWPYMKGAVTFLLVMPYFGGASYVYKCVVRPYLIEVPQVLSVVWNIIFIIASNGHDNFVEETDKNILLNEQEELEKNIVCQQEKFKPNYDNALMEFKPIVSDKVQKEWSCALCLISVSSEKDFRGHLYGKKHKAKEEEVITAALGLKPSQFSLYGVNRKNGVVLLGNLVSLISPVARSIRWCSWEKPEVGWIKLNTDGSIDRGNAGFGGLLRDHNGDAICGFVSKAPVDDIFMVELCAIWRGLVLALSVGVKVVWVESDSMSAVKTINRKQSHNGKADKCLKHIWALLKKFDEYKVTHLLRETNKAADYLSKMVSEKNDVVLLASDFPQSLLNIISDDARGRVYHRR